MGVQKALAVITLMSAFEQEPKDGLTKLYVHNDGGLGAPPEGRSDAPEVATQGCLLWRQMMEDRVAVHFARVEYRANCADGPSRDSLE